MSSGLVLADLTVAAWSGQPIVDRVSLTVRPGEVVGLAGESGSGKTTLGLAALGYARPGTRIVDGEITVANERLLTLSEGARQRIRGRSIAYVPQDPTVALNPSFRVGDQILEILVNHRVAGSHDDRVGAVLARVQLPATGAFLRRYPHQLSGGQQQRVAIAMALVADPAVVVMDEPTTGLDVITQARILEGVAALRRGSDLGILYISHDLAVVGSIADRLCVMYAGRIVEEGPTGAVLGRPHHPYTRGLAASVPDHRRPHRLRGLPGIAPGLDERTSACAFEPRCPHAHPVCRESVPPLEPVPGSERAVACFRWRETAPLALEPTASSQAADGRDVLVVTGLRASYPGSEAAVVDDVSFAIRQSEALALVGESGSGKTTIARCVAGLHSPGGGLLTLHGERLDAAARGRTRQQRRSIQLVFQNPYESLNPRHTVREIVARPAIVLGGLDRRAAGRAVDEQLERVALSPRLAERYPSQLSGGERQRVAIARALAAAPEVLVCDEITSALDVSVQATILELVDGLRRDLGLALLWISHDLGVVATITTRTLVLQHGRVCEDGRTADVIGNPTSEYARALVAAAPSLPLPGEGPLLAATSPEGPARAS